MKELLPVRGIITTVITPFRPDTKEIDWPSFRREIQTCVDAGVVGFLVPCMASEMPYLTCRKFGRRSPSPTRNPA